MSSDLGEIMDAIRALPEEEFAEIREWISCDDGATWDRQIRADAASGRLDGLLRASAANLSNRTKKRQVPIGSGKDQLPATGE